MSSTGLDHWVTTRQQWTQSLKPRSKSRQAMLAKKIETLGPETLYELVVIKNKSLNKPVPLNLMVPVLIRGWKREGVWPPSPPPGASRVLTTSAAAMTEGKEGSK